MLKVVLALLTAASILIIAFVLVPKLLLKATDSASNNAANVPLGRRLDLSVTPSQGGFLTRRLQTFAEIEAAAGFHPLTASRLPGGYQVWEQYYQDDSADVVVTYRKSERLYLVVVEHKLRPDQGGPRAPITCPTPAPGAPTPRAARFSGLFLPVGNVCGRYQQIEDGSYSFAQGLLTSAKLGSGYLFLHPHQISFTTQSGLQIAVEADQEDIDRDLLVQVAAGLR